MEPSSSTQQPSGTPALTVYYDGACPLCRAEIGHYQRQSGAEAMAFVDVSKAACPIGPDLDRDRAMARFHVRDGEGRLHSGARAFALVWRQLPAWRWAARIAALPGVTPILELGYRAFLPVRPLVSDFARRRLARRAKL